MPTRAVPREVEAPASPTILAWDLRELDCKDCVVSQERGHLARALGYEIEGALCVVRALGLWMVPPLRCTRILLDDWNEGIGCILACCRRISILRN